MLQRRARIGVIAAAAAVLAAACGGSPAAATRDAALAGRSWSASAALVAAERVRRSVPGAYAARTFEAAEHGLRDAARRLGGSGVRAREAVATGRALDSAARVARAARAAADSGDMSGVARAGVALDSLAALFGRTVAAAR